MEFITKAWRRYFEEPDEGVGTTYERFVLHRYFGRLEEAFRVRSVLEAPSFGMTGISGINSMWWAHRGIRVTVTDEDRDRIAMIKKVWQSVPLEADFLFNANGYSSLPFSEGEFDLSWSFAALWSVNDPVRHLMELTRVTRKVVFICVPNEANVCSMFRPRRTVEDGLSRDRIGSKKIPEMMVKLGWKVYEQGHLDVPPWPDIAMKKEDLLRKLGLKGLARRLERNENTSICILDYFKGSKKTMDKDFLKLGFLEDAPRIFKKFWAHHRYFIFVPEQYLPDRIRATH